MLLVLIAVAMATVLSMSFLASQATTHGVAQNVQGHAQARSVAESALVVAINYVQTDADWRTDKADGQWASNVPFNGGTFDLYGYDGLDTDGDGVVDDTDGDLADDPADPVTLKVVATADGVTHTVNAVVTVGGGGSTTQTVLMVVADPGNLDAKEQQRLDLMTGWGWAVNTLDDSDSQAQYDAAVGAVDVVLVPDTVVAGTVGTKLNSSTVGVVIEESGLADDLKISSSFSSYNGTSINVTNGNHYITSAFGSGLVQVASISGALGHPSGTLASGAQSLADAPTGSVPAVVVLEIGAALYSGGISAGRRVSIPTGDFEVADLTAQGKELLKRSLTWTGGGDTDNFLSGQWTLDEASGLIAYDSSGNGQNGPITAGSPSTQWTSGKVFGGLRFDGSGDGFIRIPDSDVLDLSDEGTLSAWIYLDGYKNFMGIIHKGEFRDWSDEAYSLQFWTSRKIALTFTTSSGTKKLIGSKRLKNGQWYHVAGTWGANGMAIYIDGVLDASNSIAAVGVPSIGSVQIGSQLSEYYNSYYKNLPFIGVIDDARIYRRTLTEKEIVDQYNQAIATSDSPQLIVLYEFQETVPPPPALVGHWPLDDAGGTAVDATSGNDGTASGGVTPESTGHGDGGTAFQFDGINGYVEVAHDTAYLLNDGAVSFWFKPDDLSGHQGLVSKDSKYNDTGGHLHIYTEGSTLKARIQSTSSSYTVQSSGLSVGNWYHVTVSFGSEGLKLYRNGSLVDSDSYTGGLGSNSGGVGNHEPMVFGAGTWTSGNLVSTPITYPFEGSVDDVRIYDRGLDDTQASDLYNGVTPSSGPATIVYDTGSFGAPLNLDIQDPGNITWLVGGGLQIDTATKIVSPTAAIKLYNALTATDQMTLEVIFAPANTSQSGPARIVSYSGSASSRNFTFGQDTDAYVTRLRTTSTTSNGVPDVSSTSVLTPDTQEHVIVSYDGENVTMYRNGTAEVIEARTGDFNWDNAFKLILGDEVTGGRDWLGRLHRVAIYDKSFNATQVDNVFSGSPPGDGTAGGTNSVDWVER